MSNLPGPEHGIFYIAIIDLNLKSALVGSSLLCDSDWYYSKGPACYVLIIYSQYCYSELLIMFLFVFIARYTCLCSFSDIVNWSTKNLIFLLYFI